MLKQSIGNLQRGNPPQSWRLLKSTGSGYHLEDLHQNPKRRALTALTLTESPYRSHEALAGGHHGVRPGVTPNVSEAGVEFLACQVVSKYKS